MLARSTISLFLLTQHLEEVLGGAPAIQTLGQQRAKDTNPRAFQAFLRYSKKTPTLRIPGESLRQPLSPGSFDSLFQELSLKPQPKPDPSLHIYWGTAPTGKPHVGYLVPLLKLADFLHAGCRVTILLADLHAQLDASGKNQGGNPGVKSSTKATKQVQKSAKKTSSTRAEGEPEDVASVAAGSPQLDADVSPTVDPKSIDAKCRYYEALIRSILETLGAPLAKLKFTRGSEFQLTPEYVQDLFSLLTLTTQRNALKAGTDVVKQSDNPLMSSLVYPLMQALDEVYLQCDAQLGGVDQRKIFTYAEKYLPMIGYARRVHLMNPMLASLKGPVAAQGQGQSPTTGQSATGQSPTQSPAIQTPPAPKPQSPASIYSSPQTPTPRGSPHSIFNNLPKKRNESQSPVGGVSPIPPKISSPPSPLPQSPGAAPGGGPHDPTLHLDMVCRSSKDSPCTCACIFYCRRTREDLLAVFPRTQVYLLMQRRTPNADRFPLHLGVPGGGIQDGETFWQGTCREVLEESGIDIRGLRQTVQVFQQHRYRKTNRLHMGIAVELPMDYEHVLPCSTPSTLGELDPSYAPGAFNHHKWVPIEELLGVKGSVEGVEQQSQAQPTPPPIHPACFAGIRDWWRGYEESYTQERQAQEKLVQVMQAEYHNDEDEKATPTATKMSSSSDPSSKIEFLDSELVLFQKLKRAYCPMKSAQENPVLDLCQHVVYRLMDPQSSGGSKYPTFEILREKYVSGEVHPMELKTYVGTILATLLSNLDNKEELMELERKAYGA